MIDAGSPGGAEARKKLSDFDGAELPFYCRDLALDSPAYLIGEAARAAGLDAGLLKSWIYRNPRIILLGRYDQKAEGTGRPQRFTLRRVISVAITVELVSLGFTASRAALIAYLFTDGELPRLSFDYLSPVSDIMLIVYSDGSSFVAAARSNLSVAEVFAFSVEDDRVPAASFLAISYGVIWRRVTRRLVIEGHRELPIG